MTEAVSQVWWRCTTCGNIGQANVWPGALNAVCHLTLVFSTEKPDKTP